MNMANKSVPEELRKLANNRALILLVELMGFLHDVGKLSSKLYENHHKRWDEDSKDFPKLKEIFEKPFSDLLKGKIEEEILKKVNTCQLRGFQRHHTGKDYQGYWPENWIEEVIHLADSKDSSEDRGRAIHKQISFKASVFGKEERMDNNLEEKRYEVYKKLEECLSKWNFTIVNNSKFWKILRREIKEILKEYFSRGLAETERAANDVTLFDHSYMTGSIAKSLVCKVISGKNSHKDFEFDKHHFEPICDLDLLLVYFDSLSFLSQSQKLPDIRGRVKILKQIKEEIKSLIEVEYPLGNCIYEDEDDLCFLVTPVNSDSFEFIKKEIFNIFNENTNGLLLPVIERKEKCKFYGKALVELKKDKYKERRYEKLITNDFIPSWTKEWNNSETRDVCILCGKMPQLNGKEKDYLCEFCWEVRYDKPKEDKGGTPWIDEIADKNGKIALIVGTFQPLDKWLSGEFLKYQMIRTLEDIGKSLPTFEEASRNFVENFYKIIEKEGDFKRFLGRHIYELELKESVKKVIGGKSFVGEIYYRLSPQSQEYLKKKKLEKIEIDKISKEIVEIVTTKPPSPSRLFRIWRELEEFSKLEGILKEMPKGLRLIFEGEDLKEKSYNNKNVGFYVLKHISRSDKAELGEITCFWDGEKLYTVERIDKGNPSDEVEKENVLKMQKEIANKLEGKEIDIVLKEEESKKEVGSFKVKVTNKEEYESYRRIISSPRGFMVIVPANKAFEVSKRIGEEFHQYFSKSLGKLSLNIGIVFSHRKIPIFALLDAGRRFINEFSQQKLEEVFLSDKHVSPEGHEVLFKINKTKVSWKIDTKLGDGKDDYYYPYFISSEDKPLYILEVVPNKPIKVHLNKFDFEYLDSNIRRFDIIIDESGKRQHAFIGKFGPRPYLLEDLEKFQKLMDIFKIIGSWTPIRDIEAITAEKRKEWSKTQGWENIREEYEKFVDVVLENKISNTTKSKLGNWENNKNFLKECILEGSFYDAIELFKSIMKIKLEEGEKYGT